MLPWPSARPLLLVTPSAAAPSAPAWGALSVGGGARPPVTGTASLELILHALHYRILTVRAAAQWRWCRLTAKRAWRREPTACEPGQAVYKWTGVWQPTRLPMVVPRWLWNPWLYVLCQGFTIRRSTGLAWPACRQRKLAAARVRLNSRQTPSDRTDKENGDSPCITMRQHDHRGSAAARFSADSTWVTLSATVESKRRLAPGSDEASTMQCCVVNVFSNAAIGPDLIIIVVPCAREPAAGGTQSNGALHHTVTVCTVK